jgi:heme oxygenase
MLLERLRDETRPLHDDIERDLESSRMYSSVEGYRLLVGRFFGFYVAWEPEVGKAIADEEFFGPRRKLPLLQRDLEALGYDEAEIEALPRCGGLPPIGNLAEAMGSLYVLEGSTLGGQVISHRVERLLRFCDGHGYAFFRSYGRAANPMWRRFGERLAAVSSPLTEETSIRSAQRTFVRLHRWL